MNRKLLQLLQDKSKDFGLTKKFIEGIAEDASKELKDDAKDEDIEALANSLAIIAKHTQGEVTRKLQEKNPKPNNEPVEKPEPPKPNNEPSEQEPAWFKAYKESMEKQLATATSEIKAMRTAKAQTERKDKISAKAKELGIPDYLLKRCTFAEDADIDKELTDFKQELVTNALLPASVSASQATSETSIKNEAEEWAKSLPDKS